MPAIWHPFVKRSIEDVIILKFLQPESCRGAEKVRLSEAASRRCAARLNRYLKLAVACSLPYRLLIVRLLTLDICFTRIPPACKARKYRSALLTCSIQRPLPSFALSLLLVEIDPIRLIRGRRGPVGEAGQLQQYVNDRPYTANSFMSVAIGEMFSTAMSGRSKERRDSPKRRFR